jgi:hypothetical protein
VGFTEGLGRLGARPLGCEETELAIRIRQRRPEALLLYDPRGRSPPPRPAAAGPLALLPVPLLRRGPVKAAVSRLVGAGDALAAERSYLRRVLPRAVVRGLIPGELPTAATVLCSLAFTASGYLRGRVALGVGLSASATPPPEEVGCAP